jgi:hypothetical protein
MELAFRQGVAREHVQAPTSGEQDRRAATESRRHAALRLRKCPEEKIDQ